MLFLKIAIRAIKPVYVKMVITQLCYFFNRISQKVINEDELQDLKEFIGETMAQLKMCFPPGLFDITEHLMIHMVDQIWALGPLYLHEMWTYERFMDRAHPEGSMVEGYNTEEVIESCLGFLKDNVSLDLPFHTFWGGWKVSAPLGGKPSPTRIPTVCNKHIISYCSTSR